MVFKYYFLYQFLFWVWNEMNLWMRFPRHPNIVSFDRVVYDEAQGRVVGFTTKFIPGGTVEDRTGVFKLEWLKKLTRITDDLNLRYGIAHQGIAPQNLLIDSTTDNLVIFDLNRSSHIGIEATGYVEERNDVKGVNFTMYEIITRNDRFRRVPHSEQNVRDLEGIEWVKHPDVELDHLVSDYRSTVMEWAKRREGRHLFMYTDAPEHIDWEATKPPPEKETQFGREKMSISTVKYVPRNGVRRLEEGPTSNWERPLPKDVPSGCAVLSSREVVRQE